MKPYHLILIFLISIMATACRDTPTIITSPVVGVWMHDIANDEAASDLRVAFEISPENTANEFRIIIAKQTPKTPITVDFLETVESISYTSISVGASLSYNIQLSQEQRDSDGDPIEHDISYIAYVYSSELGTFSNTMDALELSNNQVYQGKYRGDWNDNLFSSVPISCFVNPRNDSLYEGEFFISFDFTPTYGGVTDNGKVKMLIINNEIKDFEYSQDLPEYMGGCPGLYTGSGTVDDDFTLTINFIGDDCDGHHTDGQMKLHRVWQD